MVEVFDEPREKECAVSFHCSTLSTDVLRSSRLLGHLRTLIPKKSRGSAEETRILIFALYKKEAQRVEGMLKSKGFSVGGLHGDMSQSARL